MGRLMLLLSIAVAFAAGWTLASGPAPVAEARPKATCKDDLARARRDLAASQAETAKAKAELDRLLARERRRVEELEKALNGDPIKELK